MIPVIDSPTACHTLDREPGVIKGLRLVYPYEPSLLEGSCSCPMPLPGMSLDGCSREAGEVLAPCVLLYQSPRWVLAAVAPVGSWCKSWVPPSPVPPALSLEPWPVLWVGEVPGFPSILIAGKGWGCPGAGQAQRGLWGCKERAKPLWQRGHGEHTRVSAKAHGCVSAQTSGPGKVTGRGIRGEGREKRKAGGGKGKESPAVFCLVSSVSAVTQPPNSPSSCHSEAGGDYAEALSRIDSCGTRA